MLIRSQCCHYELRTDFGLNAGIYTTYSTFMMLTGQHKRHQSINQSINQSMKTYL